MKIKGVLLQLLLNLYISKVSIIFQLFNSQYARCTQCILMNNCINPSRFTNYQVYRIHQYSDIQSSTMSKSTVMPTYSVVKNIFTTCLPFTRYFIFLFYFALYPQILAQIWSFLLASFPSQISLFIFAGTFINFSIFCAYSLVMYFVYTRKFPILQHYRINKKELWPWQTNARQWRKLCYKTLLNVFINILIIAPLLAYLDCSKNFQMKMKMQDIPQSKLIYVFQFSFFLIVNQIWAYIMHVLFHHPWLYWIHKAHHEYNIPVSISGMYVHPIQYILSSSISTCLGYKILTGLNLCSVHVFSFIIWLTFRNFQINDSHSGYDWPWAHASALPYSSDANQQYHYFHHRYSKGNYGGILCFMDDFFHTNRQYYQYMLKCKEIKQKIKKLDKDPQLKQNHLNLV